ncbi:MAG: hypothetical protein ACJ786_36040 [Catenulispora sp.]|jgi:hypothetical protein
MTTPDERKSIKISAEGHAALFRVADTIGGTVDDAVRFLTKPTTVRVPLTTVQYRRWAQAADWAGISLPQFVQMRVEAALQYGIDPDFLLRLYNTLRGTQQLITDQRGDK